MSYLADPFAYLGMHRDDGGVVVRAVLPQASHAFVHDRSDAKLIEMQRTGDEGVFELRFPQRRNAFDYSVVVETPGGREELEDPYRFGPILGETDVYLIAEGTHLRLWEVLGSHLRTLDGVAGTTFAVWAPNAQRVSVVGDLNNWDSRRHPMRKRVECGVWEIFIPGVVAGMRYNTKSLALGARRFPSRPIRWRAMRRCGRPTRRSCGKATQIRGVTARGWPRARSGAGAMRRFRSTRFILDRGNATKTTVG